MNYTDLIMRSRYYQSASDVATTKRRTQFNKLKETYILFICKDDPFGFGLPRYTKQSRFKEIDKFVYDDKTHHLFYNCSAWQKEDDEGIREVMKFIFSLKADSNFTQKLETATDYAKANSVFKDEYMYVEDIIEEEKEIAREEGLAEGMAKGLAEGLAEGRANGLAEGIAEGRANGLAEGKASGLAEGIAEGSNKKAEDTAKALLKEGIPEETIARCVGIPLERVLDIKKTL